VKFIRYNGEWVPASAFTRPPRVAPAIIRDSIDPLRSMADGRLYDSKSQMRRAYKELGYEELGNDAPLTPPPYKPDPTIVDDVAQAYQMVEQGYVPPPVEAIDAGEFADAPVKIY